MCFSYQLQLQQAWQCFCSKCLQELIRTIDSGCLSAYQGTSPGHCVVTCYGTAFTVCVWSLCVSVVGSGLRDSGALSCLALATRVISLECGQAWSLSPLFLPHQCGCVGTGVHPIDGADGVGSGLIPRNQLSWGALASLVSGGTLTVGSMGSGLLRTGVMGPVFATENWTMAGLGCYCSSVSSHSLAVGTPFVALCHCPL